MGCKGGSLSVCTSVDVIKCVGGYVRVFVKMYVNRCTKFKSCGCPALSWSRVRIPLLQAEVKFLLEVTHKFTSVQVLCIKNRRSLLLIQMLCININWLNFQPTWSVHYWFSKLFLGNISDSNSDRWLYQPPNYSSAFILASLENNKLSS